MVDFKTFIKESIEANPIEAKIVRKVAKALRKADNPIVSVWDGDESVPVSTTKEILEVVFNLDEAILYTWSGSFVYIVLGNEWDALCDYGMSLEETLKPVNDWIERHM